MGFPTDASLDFDFRDADLTESDRGSITSLKDSVDEEEDHSSLRSTLTATDLTHLYFEGCPIQQKKSLSSRLAQFPNTIKRWCSSSSDTTSETAFSDLSSHSIKAEKGIERSLDEITKSNSLLSAADFRTVAGPPGFISSRYRTLVRLLKKYEGEKNGLSTKAHRTQLEKIRQAAFAYGSFQQEKKEALGKTPPPSSSLKKTEARLNALNFLIAGISQADGELLLAGEDDVRESSISYLSASASPSESAALDTTISAPMTPEARNSGTSKVDQLLSLGLTSPDTTNKSQGSKNIDFSNPSVQKQLSDAYVLDYLMGQQRTPESFRFIQDKPPKIQLAGHQKPFYDDEETAMPPPHLMDTETAKKITSLTPELLRTELQQAAWSEKQTAAALDRLQQLKNTISDITRFHQAERLETSEDMKNFWQLTSTLQGKDIITTWDQNSLNKLQSSRVGGCYVPQLFQ